MAQKLISFILLEVLSVSRFHFFRQPPSQSLHGFSHGRGERETGVTGDEPQGTMGRVQTAGEACCLLPAFLCAHIFIERERRLGTRQLLPSSVTDLRKHPEQHNLRRF